MGYEEVVPQGVQGIRPDRGHQIRGDPLGPDHRDDLGLDRLGDSG